jgi:hypothetical protein
VLTPLYDTVVRAVGTSLPCYVSPPSPVLVIYRTNPMTGAIVPKWHTNQRDGFGIRACPPRAYGRV